MAVLADLDEAEKYLLALLTDNSGVDQAEFCWVDTTSPEGVFRCYDYQIPWYREKEKRQIDQGARAIGKSIGIQMRAFAFPFTNPGQEMLLSAPEMIHLDPVTKYVEERLSNVRLSREFLKTSSTSNGFTHRPFEAVFRNGARIVGRIPQRDGKGLKGQHPRKLEIDEGQDFPGPGYTEVSETLKFADDNASFRIHGVPNGVRDYFFKLTQPGSGWHVNRITAMHRPDWSAEEREAKIDFHGGRESIGYRRNILGTHGDASSALFVLVRLLECVDQVKESRYNAEEYYHVRISDELVRDSAMPIEELLQFPASHLGYERVWAGADIGMTNHPTEILIFGEEASPLTGGRLQQVPKKRLKLLTRIHLERIASHDQRAVFHKVWDFYRPQGFGMDRTGLGLPIYQEIMASEHRGLASILRGYNFSEKIIVGFESHEDDTYFPDEDDDPRGAPIRANVLEYSSDALRSLVDQKEILLPWDLDLIREFQGQTFSMQRSSMDPYGRKIFNAGKFHALDGARMAALAHAQERIDQSKEVVSGWEPVLDGFLT